MRITLLGANGMLGQDVHHACKALGHDVVPYDLPDFDITDEEQVRQSLHGADAVVNCAAYTNVDGAESHQDLATAVNAEACSTLGVLAKELGVYVVHISTDFVFDGQKDGIYTELDEPNPISEYGASKLNGEELLQSTGCEHAIIRVEWTYGIHAPQNFVAKLAERAKTNPELKMVDDQFGSPTPTTLVAQAICKCLDKRPNGLFLLSAGGHASRFEIAQFILDHLSLDNALSPCKTSDFAAPAARPLNSRFDCTRISAALDLEIRPWQDYLRDYLLNHKEHIL